MNSNVFRLQVLKNNHADEVSDEMTSCSSCDTDDNLSITPLNNEKYIDQNTSWNMYDHEDAGPITLADLNCSRDDDDILSEVSSICYDETDDTKWDGAKTLPICDISPFTDEDVKEARRLGMTVDEMFEMYREITNYVEQESDRYNCSPEWPLHVGIQGTYEDEGFCESYYG